MVNHSTGAHQEEQGAIPVEEQLVAMPTSPFGGLHEVGDPGAQPMSSAETTVHDDAEMGGDPSSVGLRSAMEQTVGASSVLELQSSGALSRSLGQRAPPPVATVEEIKEIHRERTPSPWLVQKVIRHGNQFETIEEDAADAEIGRLRADLSAMMTRIEVRSCQNRLVLTIHGMLQNVLVYCRMWQGSPNSGDDSLKRSPASRKKMNNCK